jgi:ribosomal-protein-serine acetyltransferase
VFSHKLTEDTQLRLLEVRHAKELTDLSDRNREHLRAWLPWVDANRTVEDRKNFIRDALKQFAQNKGFVAGIWHEGRLAGVIGYDAIDWENRTTEVGYWLGKEHQGKGLVTAACRALVDHAFLELGLNRVVISCATENEKSCA